MGKKLFGEFLLEKKVISLSDLVESLIEQVSTTPTSIEIAWKHSLISDEEIIRTLSYQIKNGLNFERASSELGIWTEDLGHEIEKYLEEERHPLGQILLKNEKLDFMQLADLLDEFLREPGEISDEEILEGKPEEAKEGTSVSLESVSPEVAAPEESQEVAAQFSPTFHDLDPFVVKEYLEIFSTDQKEAMEKISNCLKGIEDIKNIFKEFHKLKGTARFIKAQITEEILAKAEKTLGSGISNEFLEDAHLEKITFLNKKILEVLWELRNSIESSSNEKSAWYKDEFRQKFNLTMNLIIQTAQELKDAS